MVSTQLSLTDRFQILESIGDGSFGSVSLAKVRPDGKGSAGNPGDVVAIKSMKKVFRNPADYLRLREVLFLRALPSHPQIVRAFEIFLDLTTNKLHIVMESMEMNLYQFIKTRQPAMAPFDLGTVTSIMYQILTGLDHIHSHGYFHRDIKPENVLISAGTTRAGLLPGEDPMTVVNNGLATPGSSASALVPGYVVKITDFGLARELQSKAPYTSYVSTRWYRAPEILLKAGYYSSPVDMWALGAIAVELALLKPLFPGVDEWDQLFKIADVLGSPEKATSPGGLWTEATRYAYDLGIVMPQKLGLKMETILPPQTWTPELADFVRNCMYWDPARRCSSSTALKHGLFR
ncbi:kinase-like domain-containing protein, partial [Dipodascopsis tothii]|uniref:kinase-like domain-containing protein n=1 Tax=Dipodascopsis tothii TaxID=44089 RepID=UPI0034CF1A32